MDDPFRVYTTVGRDGYPAEWHETIKHLVREQAGNRCERCGHPYRNGEHGNGEWSPCDESCHHGAPVRSGETVEARWRILTVHHLNGDKADCRWWNLAALCQRCHLRIQGTVDMNRVWPWQHSPWFELHAAGWYAHAYLGETLTRDETATRLPELLALERVA